MSAQLEKSWLIEDLKSGVYEMHCLFDSVMSVSTVDQSKIELSYDNGGAVNIIPTTTTMISTSNSKYLIFSVDAAFRNIIEAYSDANKGILEIKLDAGAFKDQDDVACGATAYTDNIRCHVINLDLTTLMDYEISDTTTKYRDFYLPRDTTFQEFSTPFNTESSVAKTRIYGGGIASNTTNDGLTTNNTTIISGDINIEGDDCNVQNESDPVYLDIFNCYIDGEFNIGTTKTGAATENAGTMASGSSTLVFAGLTINEYQGQMVYAILSNPTKYISSYVVSNTTTDVILGNYTASDNHTACVAYFPGETNAPWVDFSVTNCVITGSITTYNAKTDRGFSYFDRCIFLSNITILNSAQGGTFQYPYYQKISFINCISSGSITESGTGTFDIAAGQTTLGNSHINSDTITIKFPFNITGSADADIENADESGLIGYTLAELQEGTSWSSGDRIIIGKEFENNSEKLSGIPKGNVCQIGAFQNAVTQNLTITDAVLSGSDKIVTLTTTETLTATDTYRVSASNIEDADGNIIEDGTTEIFVAT